MLLIYHTSKRKGIVMKKAANIMKFVFSGVLLGLIVLLAYFMVTGLHI